MTLSNGTTTRMILPLTYSTYTNTSSVSITKGLQYEIDETTGVLKRVAEQDVNTKSGWWGWRFQWSQVHPWHAGRLVELARLYGRI